MTAAQASPDYMSGHCQVRRHGSCAGVYVGVDCTCACHLPGQPDPTALASAVDTLDEQVGAWFETAGHVELLDLLATTRTLRSRLAQVESVLEHTAAKSMPADVVEWDGGVAERRWGRDRKEWAHADLTRTVANRIAEDAATDPTTGETDSAWAAVVMDAIAAYAATNRPSWRVTALKPLGIDPDEFCSSSPGRPTVQITPAGGQA